MSFRLRRLFRRIRGGRHEKSAAITASTPAQAVPLTAEDVEELFERRRRRKHAEVLPPAGLAALACRA